MKKKPASRSKPQSRGSRVLRRPAAETTAIVVRDPQGLLPAPIGPIALPQIVPHAGLMAQGLSRFKPTKAQSAALQKDFPDSEINLLPSGEVYVDHATLRTRLNQVFGNASWALDPRQEPMVEKSGKRTKMMQQYLLLVEGQVASPYVWGEAVYYEDNPQQSWARAFEAVRSIAVRRICKEIGVGLQCWHRRFGYRFKLAFGILVNVRQRDGKVKPQWRRYDDPPFPFEVGIHAKSPNKDRYRQAPTDSERETARFDEEPEYFGEVEPPAQSVRDQTATGEPAKDTRSLSEGQVKRLHAIAGELKRDKARLKAWIQATYHVESSKDIPRWQYEDLVSCIEEGSCYLEPGSDG